MFLLQLGLHSQLTERKFWFNYRAGPFFLKFSYSPPTVESVNALRQTDMNLPLRGSDSD